MAVTNYTAKYKWRSNNYTWSYYYRVGICL